MMEDYEKTHQHKVNLFIHMLTVPLFWVGTYMLLSGLWRGGKFAVAGAAAMFLAMGAQKIGHSFEEIAPAPFKGPRDVIVRIFREQFYLFPYFFAMRHDNSGPPT